jgi:hypothetical protein
MVNLNNGGNVIMTEADFVPNVEMANAPNLVRPNTVRQLRARAEFHARMANQEARIKAAEKAQEKAIKNAVKKAAEEKARETAIKNAAKQAEENARREAVNRSKAEATAAKAAARAKREKSNRNIAAAEKAAENAEKAKKAAKKAAENAEKAKKAAKKAAENAEKAKKAKKLAANAIVKNVDNKFKEIQRKTNLSKTEKNKEGTKVYRKASLKLHPQRLGGNNESFVKLGKAFHNFQTKIGTKVTAGFNETWTG